MTYRTAGGAVHVWDARIRIIHWGIAALVITDLVNESGANPWHRYCGYAAAALVVIRLGLGLLPSDHARLTRMLSLATRALPYIKSVVAGDRGVYVGHNPLGACMAFTLWALTLLVAATGWMLRLDAFWGSESLQSVHLISAYTLAACAAVHVTGVVTTSVLYRTNLIAGMISGNKTFR